MLPTARKNDWFCRPTCMCCFSSYKPFHCVLCRSVRLPKNGETGHGVVLGEGKPENQNAAVIFCFGEVVQVRWGKWDKSTKAWGEIDPARAEDAYSRACVSAWQRRRAQPFASTRCACYPFPLRCVQAIDMNQDNFLAEALKMRNLVSEFNPPVYNDLTAAAGGWLGGRELGGQEPRCEAGCAVAQFAWEKAVDDWHADILLSSLGG